MTKIVTTCSAKTDPVSRYVYITYYVPDGMADEVSVQCRFQKEGSDRWYAASVWPYMSETALSLVDENTWNLGIETGCFVERCAKGTNRVLIFNPFHHEEASFLGWFEINISDGLTTAIAKVRLELDNRDVLCLDDWSRVIQNRMVTNNAKDGLWLIKQTPAENGKRRRNILIAAEKNVCLPQLTYPMDCAGMYAVFVCMKSGLGAIELRLSKDERYERFGAGRNGFEMLWRWTDLTRCHLVIRQPWHTVHEYEDDFRACIERVRFVPLNEAVVLRLNEQFETKRPEQKKWLIGYNEPYSWAFSNDVQTNLQHKEPLIAFAEARVDRMDIQIGRAGSKMSFESRKADQDIDMAYGDPVRGKVPVTDNVGKMQQYTNMLSSQLLYADQLGMKVHANMGATGCYIGTPAAAAISIENPAWVVGNCLRYDEPKVVQYILDVFEETLQIGAQALSVDWCRYPDSIDDKETINQFFCSLRALADRYGEKTGKRIEILTRFPANGVRKSDVMDYRTWIEKEWIDFLCPSNIQGRHMHFDITPYVQATKNTRVRCLPCVDGLLWGMAMPDMFLKRVIDCLQKGADGIYIYQCDNLTPNPVWRRHLAKIPYQDCLERWFSFEKGEQTRYSKNIYITSAMIGAEHDQAMYYACERLRIHCEGIVPNRLECWIDDECVNVYEKEPYVLASEELSDDYRFSKGRHTLRIVAYTEIDRLERMFEVSFETKK